MGDWSEIIKSDLDIVKQMMPYANIIGDMLVTATMGRYTVIIDGSCVDTVIDRLHRAFAHAYYKRVIRGNVVLTDDEVRIGFNAVRFSGANMSRFSLINNWLRTQWSQFKSGHIEMVYSSKYESFCIMCNRW